eukprot:comp18902_c0_seq1/m.34647 comp18902_c0_seq1/g.34647  ORF comp18902_c0_seq1/g.34647 comp18902_c0_seq1/m.34647 type:complete len:266 (+) comp18902_c0_seq1:56-853(+)
MSIPGFEDYDGTSDYVCDTVDLSNGQLEVLPKDLAGVRDLTLTLNVPFPEHVLKDFDRAESLTSLQLDKCELNDHMARVFARHFPRTLVTLNISENSLSDDGYVAIADAASAAKTLETLNIGRNAGVTKKGMEAIARLITHAPLTMLDMAYDLIEDPGCEVLGAALAHNPRLEYLYLQGNEISDAGVSHLARGLAKNTHLRSLDLEGNLVTKKGLLLLNKTVEEHKTGLTNILLVLNKIEYDDMDELTDALRKNEERIENENNGE